METASRLRAAEIVTSLSDPATLPEVATKAIRLLSDSRSSSQDLAKVISLDQGITARVLALANSAHFGTSRRFVTVREAIIRLGYRNVQAILYAASASSALCRPVALYAMGRNELWKHSIACAACSRLIAKEYQLWDAEEAYVAGLLHDIGLPSLDRFVEHKSELVRLIRSADYPLYMAEQMVLGFDHAYLGSLICQKWQLTDDVITAVSSHHEPLIGSQRTKLAAIIHLADVVSLLPEVGAYNPYFSLRADPGVPDLLHLGPHDIDRIVPQLRAYLHESEDLIMGTVVSGK